MEMMMAIERMNVPKQLALGWKSINYAGLGSVEYFQCATQAGEHDAGSGTQYPMATGISPQDVINFLLGRKSWKTSVDVTGSIDGPGAATFTYEISGESDVLAFGTSDVSSTGDDSPTYERTNFLWQTLSGSDTSFPVFNESGFLTEPPTLFERMFGPNTPNGEILQWIIGDSSTSPYFNGEATQTNPPNPPVTEAISGSTNLSIGPSGTESPPPFIYDPAAGLMTVAMSFYFGQSTGVGSFSTLDGDHGGYGSNPCGELTIKGLSQSDIVLDLYATDSSPDVTVDISAAVTIEFFNSTP